MKMWKVMKGGGMMFEITVLRETEKTVTTDSGCRELKEDSWHRYFGQQSEAVRFSLLEIDKSLLRTKQDYDLKVAMLERTKHEVSQLV